MAKEKGKVELRPIDEETSVEEDVIRLHKDGVSEVAGKGPEKGVEDSEKSLGAAERRELKMRPRDPGLDELIQANPAVMEGAENEWVERPATDKRPLWSWVVVFLILLGAGILWSVTQVGRSQKEHRVLVAQAEQIVEKEKAAEAEAEKLIATITETVRRVLEAGSVEEMLQYVRHPGRVEALMLDYYSREPFVSLDFMEVAALQPITVEKHASFWGVGCRIGGGGYEQVLVEVLDDGEVKLDWETLVLYQPMDWNEFVRTRPRGYTGDFRVNVTNDNFYSYEFADSERYLSLRLSVLNEEEVVFGYVERASAAGLEIQRIFEEIDSDFEIPMILTLHVPGEAISSKGVEVSAMRSPRWMYVESPEIEME